VILLDSSDVLRVEEGDFVEIGDSHVIVQQSDGNFQLWKGPLGGGLCVLWETGTDETTSDSYTIMQHDGNLVTYRGPDPIFSAGVTRESGVFYFVMDCEEQGDFVAIYDGNPNLNGNAERLWFEAMDPACANPPPTSSPTEGKGGGDDNRKKRGLRSGNSNKLKGSTGKY